MSNHTKAYGFIPTDKMSQDILRQRAHTYAELFEDIAETSEGLPYVKFRLGQQELYGIEFSVAKGIVQVTNLKKPPNVSPAICGVINYQGKLLGVIDLEKILSLKSATKDSASSHNIIIVNTAHMMVGLLVGEIEMSDTYNQNTLTDTILTDQDIQKGFIKGIDKGRISIINVEKVLGSIKMAEGEVS